jgi:hypothetical protein
MIIGLDSLKELTKKVTPSDIEFIYYIFWEKGIDLERFNQLPIPYILSIVKVFNYIKKEEEKALKKNGNKK